jgi:hypothetical protein
VFDGRDFSDSDAESFFAALRCESEHGPYLDRAKEACEDAQCAVVLAVEASKSAMDDRGRLEVKCAEIRQAPVGASVDEKLAPPPACYTKAAAVGRLPCVGRQ